MALSTCTVPTAGQPGFVLGDNEIELGLSIHGEPGVRRGPLESADTLIDRLLDVILADLSKGNGDLRGRRPNGSGHRRAASCRCSRRAWLEHRGMGCQALLRLVEELRAELAATEAQRTAEIAALKAEIARLRKNSGNSSKPPSTDFGTSKPKAKPIHAADGDAKNKRKRGAQPGHEPHFRDPFADGDVCYTELYCTECPDCHGPVTPSKEPPRVIQRGELLTPPELIAIGGVRPHAAWCRKCKQVHYLPFDEPTKRAGLTGPRLTALAAYLKGVCHCSYTTIKRFFRDLFGLKLSRGYLAKLIAKTSDSAKDAYDDLAQRLSKQGKLNIDETGHKDYKTSMWTWCFRASLFTLFKIDPSRGSDVLVKMLGDEWLAVAATRHYETLFVLRSALLMRLRLSSTSVKLGVDEGVRKERVPCSGGLDQVD